MAYMSTRKIHKFKDLRDLQNSGNPPQTVPIDDIKIAMQGARNALLSNQNANWRNEFVTIIRIEKKKTNSEGGGDNDLDEAHCGCGCS
jgi:hypothetical protein